MTDRELCYEKGWCYIKNTWNVGDLKNTRVIKHSIPTIEEDDIAEVVRCLKSGRLDDSDKVSELERFSREFLGRKYAVAVSSGFAAIHLSLVSLKIKPGDEVILPSYSCKALLNPIKLLGAEPKVVDIESDGFNIDCDQVKKICSKRTKAIIVPHMFGFPASLDELLALDIPIIEDCAQAVGAKYRGKRVGSLGATEIYSFYASKMITGGDGGMILFDDDSMYELIQNSKYYGHKKNNFTVEFNYHLTNLPASLALSQMKKIDKFIERRLHLANLYDQCFQDTELIFNDFKNKRYSIFYRYPILITHRDFLKKELNRKGIYCGYGVLEPNHKFTNSANENYKNTNFYLDKVLSIPIYPSMKDEDIFYISETIKEVVKRIK